MTGGYGSAVPWLWGDYIGILGVEGIIKEFGDIFFYIVAFADCEEFFGLGDVGFLSVSHSYRA